MSAMLIHNIGQIVSGDFRSPILEGDSILIDDGMIVEIGTSIEAVEGMVRIDASGTIVHIDTRRKFKFYPILLPQIPHPAPAPR